ncbi:MAG: ATP-dependent endonuclease, partial [bacterium]
INGPLAPRHFRNIWYHFPEDFDQFARIVENTWSGVLIKPPKLRMDYRPGTEGGAFLDMFFREDGIDREVFWAGHGLQVWFQLLTHISRLSHLSTLILDEPDIYLHSDVQRRLVDICGSLKCQVIIATHSVDMINEVDPEQILSVDKRLREAQRLSTAEDVQRCIETIGSAQNVRLASFLRARACLFVEGKDTKILKRLARALGRDSFLSPEKFSVIELEGGSNWQRVIHFDWLFRNVFGDPIRSYLLLDRDYMTESQARNIVETLASKGVHAHIWARKELENYLVVRDVIHKAVLYAVAERSRRLKEPVVDVTPEEVWDIVLECCEEMKNRTRYQLLANALEEARRSKLDGTTVMERFDRAFEVAWKSPEKRLSFVSGKELLGTLNSRLAERYKVSIPISLLINSLEASDIHDEVRGVIEEISDFAD